MNGLRINESFSAARGLPDDLATSFTRAVHKLRERGGSSKCLFTWGVMVLNHLDFGVVF